MSRHLKIAWLISLLLLLFAMVLVGGATRLTKSGLSITEWKPVTGLIPPSSEDDWRKEFDLYRKSPEFHHHNSHFQIEDYQRIFWWEFAHRALGRVIFFWTLVMGIVFWWKGEWSGRRAAFLPALVALQGLVGWLMVKTGLHQRPSVSHYMLTLHFTLALTTLSIVYFPLARMKRTIVRRVSRRGAVLLGSLGALLAFQLVYGGLTAGLKAGFHFNSFPLMGGEVLPERAWDYSPFWKNFVENPIMVQWIHRWLGVALGVFTPVVGLQLIRGEGRSFCRPVLHLVSVVAVQIVLGVSSLLMFVPIPLALAHQGMAILVWLGYCNLVFRIREVKFLRHQTHRRPLPLCSLDRRGQLQDRGLH